VTTLDVVLFIVIGALLIELGMEILKKCMTRDNNFMLILISLVFGISGFSLFILTAILPNN
jgi:uncharacterized membrane protein